MPRRRRTGSRFPSWPALLAALALLALSALPPGVLLTAAQTAAPPDLASELPAGVSLEILGGGVVDAAALPAPPATLLLERVLVQPGQGTNLEPAAGVEILLVEEGTLSITDELGIEGAYPAGSQLFVNPGLVFSYANRGGEPVSLLRVAIGSGADIAGAAAASPAASPAPQGTPPASPTAETQTGALIALPVGEWPGDAAFLFLARSVWEPGAELPSHTFAGPLGLIALDGVLNVAGPSGIEGQLPPGRAVAFPAAIENRQRNAGTEPATVMLVGVAPVDGPWLSAMGQPTGDALLVGTPPAGNGSSTVAVGVQPGTVPMFHANAARTGVMPGPGPQGTPILRWSYPAEAPVRTAPAVADSMVFFATATALHAVDTVSGEVRWIEPVRGATSSLGSSPAIDAGRVYIGSAASGIYAFDAASGDEVWTFDTDGAVFSSPAILDGVVYAGGGESLFAIDAESGAELWAFETSGSVGNSPAIESGAVVVDGDRQILHAVDASNGAERWRFQTTGAIDSSPAIANETVFVGTIAGIVHAINLDTGAEVWRFEAPGTNSNIPSTPAIAGDTVYICTSAGPNRGTLHALDVATGAERWRFEADSGCYSSPAVASNSVYAVMANSDLHVLDAATGAERWRYDADGSNYSSPAVVDGVVYFGSTDEFLYAIGGTEGELAITPTPVPVAEGETVVVIVPSTSLRAAPSAAGVVIQELQEGTTLQVVGPVEERDGKDWWRVEVEGVGSGYVEAGAIAVAG